MEPVNFKTLENPESFIQKFKELFSFLSTIDSLDLLLNFQNSFYHQLITASLNRPTHARTLLKKDPTSKV